MATVRSQESSPFSTIRSSVNRSLSTRAHQLRRRISSTSKIKIPASSLCIHCDQLDLRQVSQTLANSTYNPDGVVLGELPDNIAASDCSLCRILYRACKETCSGPSLQIRAFDLLPHLLEQWHEGNTSATHRTSDIFLAAVPGQFSMIPGGADRAVFDDMVSKRGFLIYYDDNKLEDCMLKSRLVTRHFQPSVVQNWLRTCSSLHHGCRYTRRPQTALNLIDCRSHTVLKAADIYTNPADLEYVALSYVWGQSLEVSRVVLDGSRLPQPIPAVIRDAMEVVLMLGYQYLWIDKYCIDKHDKSRIHEQLMDMDSIYQDAALTIVAAAGSDESYGLPGVSKSRPCRQLTFKRDAEHYALASTLPLPHSSIAESRWATRGWTYQEAILSRRRLVFTDDQVYFECNSSSRAEGFDICFDDRLFGSAASHDHFIRPSLFSLKQLVSVSSNGKATRLSNFFTYVHCAEQYSKRTLSFDNDALIAFSGIIRVLESISTFPVRHIWGIPFFHPDDDNLSDDQLWSTYKTFQLPASWKSPVFKDRSVPKSNPPVVEVDYLAYLMLGLCWRHLPSVNPRRRKDFPSWSWTGWEGALAWPNLTKASNISRSTWDQTAISLGPISSESIPDLYHNSTNTHLLFQSDKSLHVRTSAIKREAFIFDESSCGLVFTTGGEVKLYASKNDIDASKVFKRIQSLRYEVIKMATVDEHAYMMLIKRYRNAYYRIGTMAVEDRYVTNSLFTSKVTTYKLR